MSSVVRSWGAQWLLAEGGSGFLEHESWVEPTSIPQQIDTFRIVLDHLSLPVQSV